MHDSDCEPGCSLICCETGYYRATSYLRSAVMHKHDFDQIMRSLYTIKGISDRAINHVLSEAGIEAPIEAEGSW